MRDTKAVVVVFRVEGQNHVLLLSLSVAKVAEVAVFGGVGRS